MTKVNKLVKLLGVTSLCAGLSLGAGCSSPGKKTAAGAGAGAVGGAVVGGVIGGGKGAAIGAGVGAVVGGAYGNYLDKRQKELDKIAETQKTKNGLLVKIRNELLFDVDSAEVKDNAESTLKEISEVLAKYPEDRIVVKGHTDSTGDAKYNQQLAGRRAKSVRDELMENGVKPDRLKTLAAGEREPVATNENDQGRMQNRRVELIIQVPKDAAKKG